MFVIRDFYVTEYSRERLFQTSCSKFWFRLWVEQDSAYLALAASVLISFLGDILGSFALRVELNLVSEFFLQFSFLESWIMILVSLGGLSCGRC